MPRCRMRLWIIALFLPLLIGCGSESPSPASPTSLTDTPAQSAPAEPIATDRNLPPGPPIGTFVQPKDVIVMVDRDETDPNAQNEELGLAKTFGLSKVADTLLDDYDTGSFTRYGPSYCGPPVNGPCWKESSSGYNGHMWWTYNNKYTTSNYAIWQPYLQCAGVYSVLAHIPNNNATTTKAPYTISHAYGNTPYNINQNNFYNQWVGMGSYTFNKSGSSVKLIDATGETLATKKIGFDAMKWTWVNGINTLTINYPNGGETWYKSGCLGVSWSSSLTDNVRIHLYRYGSIHKGLTNSTPNDGYECIPASYFSDVPSGGGYDIRMSNVNSYCDGATYDQSNGTFSIYSPSVTVNSPNGGESYMGTGTMGITWSSAGLSGNIRIQLCQYGNCNITIHDGASNTGNYTWNILNISGSGYKIRLTSVNDGSIWDESNSGFTITAPPPPVVTISTNSGYDFTTTASSVQIAGTCTDGNNDIDWIRYNNSATGWNTTNYDPSGGYFNFAPTINLTPGANPIQVTCQDMAGAVSSDSITVTYTPVGAISGTVTNSGGSALNNAIVTATGPTMTATASTNSSGQYSMGGLPIGTCSVKANMSGHTDQTKTTSVTTGGNSVVDFALIKIPKSILSYSPLSISTTINSGTMDGSKSFVVKNTGDAAMNYTLSVNVPWISLQRNGAMATGSSFGLSAGAQDTVFVIFNSNGITSTPSPQGVITITATHNDLSQETKTIVAEMTLNPPAPQPPAPAEQPAPATPAFQPAQYGACKDQSRCFDDPVNTAIGNFLYQHTDLKISARGPILEFTRYYNSLDTTLGPMGLGWGHSLNSQVITAGNGDAYIRWGNGQTDLYVYNSNTGTFTRPAGVFSTLTKGSQYIFTDRNQNVWVFSLSGLLQSITDSHNNKLVLSYDPQGRLEYATSAVGDKLTFEYISATDSKLKSVTDHAGRKIQFNYTGNLLTQVLDERMKLFGFEYVNNRLSQITERNNKIVVKNAYDSTGRVTDQYNGSNYHTVYQYDTPAAGQTTVTDAKNRKHIYSYDALFRLIKHEAPGGKFTAFKYNTENQITEWVDENGTIYYGYDSNGNLLSFKDAVGTTHSWTYDAANRPITHTSPHGLLTSFDYDTAGNLSKSSYTLSGTLHETKYDYYATGELKTITDPLLHMTSFAYHPKGELAKMSNHLGESIEFTEYDSLHRRKIMLDPVKRQWTYSYDITTNTETISGPLSLFEKFIYDDLGRVKDYITPAGTTTYSYTDAGNLDSVTDPGGTTIYGYDELNERASIKDENGKITKIEYDLHGYPNKIIDATSRSTSWVSNSTGYVQSNIDSNNQSTSYTPNAVGQPTKITNNLSETKLLNYSNGLLKSIEDQTSKTKFTIGHDELGRATTVTNNLLLTTVSQSFDKAGRLKNLTTPRGKSWTWNYDDADRIQDVISPSGNKRSLTYFADGQVKTITNAKNQTTTFDYDGAGRIQDVTFADGTKRSITEYDALGPPKTISESGLTRQFTYHSNGYIASSIDVWDKQISYTYYPDGSLKTITYPGNKTVTYTYDDAGRMKTLTDFSGGFTTYNYDAAGRLETTVFPNGVTSHYGYDLASRLKSVTHKKPDGSVFQSFSAILDTHGRITSIDVTPEPTAWIPADTTDYVINKDEDQYDQVGSELMGYDSVGQLIGRTKGGTTSNYTFDARERLTGMNGSVAASFAYGPVGERIQKTVNGTVTRYVVDTNAKQPRVLAELDSNNTITAYYIFGVGLVARFPATGNDARYYHDDLQSNIVALSDSNAAITDTYFYHPFGKVLAKTGTSTNPYQFVGRLGVETDGTGLLYMRARYYDPSLGRFVSMDPLGHAGGDVNLYTYALNNPVGIADPSGMLFDILADIAFIAYDVYTLIKEPSWSNVTALGLDIAGAAIPVATGLGAAYRTAKTINKAADAAKSINKGLDLYNPTVRKLVKAANKADKIDTVGKTAREAGTLKHTAAEKIVNQVMPKAGTELSYKGGEPLGRRIPAKGSKRMDVVIGNPKSPDTIYDFKFGKSGSSATDIEAMQTAVGKKVPVFDIRPGPLPLSKPMAVAIPVATGIVTYGVTDLIVDSAKGYFSPQPQSTTSTGPTPTSGKAESSK